MASRLTFSRFFRTSSPSPIFSPPARFLKVPSSSSSSPFVRTMATAQQKYEFLVVVPDKPGQAVREKRLEVRHLHFNNMKPFIEDGSWQMGGALLNGVPKDDEPSSLDFMGSTLVCIAESAEQVKEQLSKDIYATSGVWDMEKIQIYPFRCAFRKAMNA